MQRVLVGYATRAGSTAEVAGFIADELRARGIDVVVADLRDDPDPAGFDGFVLGSATQALTWLPESLTWLRKHGEDVGRAALFNVSITAVDPAKQDVALGHNKAAVELVEATSQAAFAGRYTPEKVGLFKKLLFWILAKKPADHVDPPTIRAWARELDFMRTSEAS